MWKTVGVLLLVGFVWGAMLYQMKLIFSEVSQIQSKLGE